MLFWVLVGILIAVFAASTIWELRTRRGTPLLRVNVATPDGASYYVHLKKIHPDMSPVEYVRLSLNMAAKLVYNLDDGPEAGEFLHLMRASSQLNWEEVSDLPAALGLPISVEEAEGYGWDRTVEATLRYTSIRTRGIQTKIPLRWFEGQFARSWVACTQASLGYLDQGLRDRLRGALRRLVYLYDSGQVDPFSMQEAAHSADRAFDEAEPGGRFTATSDRSSASTASLGKQGGRYSHILETDRFVNRTCVVCGSKAAVFSTPRMFTACPHCLSERMQRLEATEDVPSWVPHLKTAGRKEARRQEAAETAALSVDFDDFCKCSRCGKLIPKDEARYHREFGPGVTKLGRGVTISRPHCGDCYEESERN